MQTSAGIFQQSQERLMESAVRNNGIFSPEDIADYGAFMRENDMDSHIGLHSQNGGGKSMSGLIIKKCMKAPMDLEHSLIMPTHSVAYAIDAITSMKKSNIMFDEMTLFLPYLQNASTPVKALFSAFEVSRARGNVIISCARDFRKINNNYRNGKVGLLIYIIDTLKGPDVPYRSYGVVLVGNINAQVEDKFFLNWLYPTYNIKDLQSQLERLPSFAGYIFFDEVDKYLSNEELTVYKQMKEEGIGSAALMHKKKLAIMEKKIEKLLETDESKYIQEMLTKEKKDGNR